MRKVHKNENGFTLIELLVVILIIGILAAIAVPVFMNQRKKSNDAVVESDVKTIATQIETILVKEHLAETISVDNSANPAASGGGSIIVKVGERGASDTIPLSNGVVVSKIFKANGVTKVQNGYVIEAYHVNGSKYTFNTPSHLSSSTGKTTQSTTPAAPLVFMTVAEQVANARANTNVEYCVLPFLEDGTGFPAFASSSNFSYALGSYVQLKSDMFLRNCGASQPTSGTMVAHCQFIRDYSAYKKGRVHTNSLSPIAGKKYNGRPCDFDASIQQLMLVTTSTTSGSGRYYNMAKLEFRNPHAQDIPAVYP